MAEELLAKSERLTLIQMREDYIEIFHTHPEWRLEKPELWHQILDQYDAITDRLEADEGEKAMLTTTRKLDDCDNLMIKKLNGTEHPLGKWEMAHG
jgi:hypothetical protein